jgi:hypothetical protein
MSSVDNIVDVVVTIADLAPQRPSFGIPILIGYHTRWIDVEHRLYGSTAEMLTDGFTTSDYLYNAATTLMSQAQAPKQFMIGRRHAPLTQVVTLIPTNTTQGYVYRLTVAGTELTYTVLGGADATSIGTALAALIDALSSVAAVSVTGTITVTASTPGAPVDYAMNYGKSPDLTVLETTADTTTDDVLAAVDAELDGDTVSWYGATVCDSSSKATALLLAAYVEGRSQKAIAVVQSSDTACGDSGSSTDTMAALQTGTYTRTGCFFHKRIAGTEWLACGVLGGRLAVDPGVETWAFRPVAGVTVDKLKSAFKSAVDTKNGNIYVTTHSTNISWEGKAASGRFLDVTRFIDWQNSEIDFDVFVELATPPKEPFTSRGLSHVKLTIEGSLKKGVNVGGIADDVPVVVTAPAIGDISVTDKASRKVGATSPFKFSYTLSGALHSVAVRGTVSS